MVFRCAFGLYWICWKAMPALFEDKFRESKQRTFTKNIIVIIKKEKQLESKIQISRARWRRQKRMWEDIKL